MLKVVDHYFIFDGKSSLDFGARIDGNQTFGSAERDYEVYEVPGRNGSLTIDNGRFREKTVTYEGFIVGDFDDRSEALRNFLSKDSEYHRLEDTIHPDEYRLAMYPGPFDPKVIFLESGSFSLKFRCRPERWLKSGEIPVTVSARVVTLLNPTYFTAKPEITVVSGTGPINIGDEILTVTENPGGLVIDCEIEDAFIGLTNMNAAIERTTGGFPTLKPGKTVVTVGNEMTVQIRPRWWMI